MISNYDHCLRFQVLDKRISFIDGSAAEVVADNRGCICVHIDFDDQWDGIAKIARFIYNGNWKDVVLDADGDCYCPSEVIKKGRFSVGVYGADLKTTTPITVTVVASILSDSKEELPDDPTPDVYEQLLTQYSVAIEEADKATQAAWDASTKADEAITALNAAKQEMEEAGFVNSIKEMNHGKKFRVWVGTQEEYDALTETQKKSDSCLFLLSDDNFAAKVLAKLTALEATDKALSNEISNLESRIDEPKKLLWEGAFYMMDTQEITLSETVSSQKNGLLLVFVPFDTTGQEITNKYNDHEMNSFFISKECIIQHTGYFSSFTMFTSHFGGVWANKQLIIDNTTIKGYTTNNGTQNYNNFTLHNSNFILRYVYGV